MKKKRIIRVLIPFCLLSFSAHAADYFTEEFFGFDMDGYSLTFTPDASPSGYSANAVQITELPVDPAGHTQLPFTGSGDDDKYVEVNITGGETVELYGSTYNRYYVGSNGYITFGTGDAAYSGGLATHFSKPRISGLFDDLHPGQGGVISTEQLSDRMVVTFFEVTELGSANTNTCQIEMFFDSRIRLSWLGIDANSFIAGLSDGSGLPVDFTESDFSDYAGDTDGDGLPNEWELQYFADATLADPLVDSDLDGHNNLAEYISGMNPTNSASVFQVTQDATPVAGGDTRCILSWTAVEGREYAIRWSNDLAGDFSNILGSGIAYPVNAFTTTVDQAQSSRFFKVDVQLAE